MDKILKILQENKEYIEQNSELARAIKTLATEHKKLKQSQDETEELRSMSAHELRGLFTVTGGFANCVLNRDLPPEKKETYLNLIRESAKKGEHLCELMYVTSLDPQKIRDSPSAMNFDVVEDVTRNILKIYSPLMIEPLQIQTQLHYDSPCVIYSDRAIFNAIIGTLSSNSLEHAPKQTTINQGIRKNKGNLEIIFENQKNSQTNNLGFGFKRGLGLNFLKKVIKKHQGKIENYSTPLNFNNYQHQEIFGEENLQKQDDSKKEVYGIKVEIPLKNLTW